MNMQGSFLLGLSALQKPQKLQKLVFPLETKDLPRTQERLQKLPALQKPLARRCLMREVFARKVVSAEVTEDGGNPCSPWPFEVFAVIEVFARVVIFSNPHTV
jgi:hypothetical protein